MLPIRFKAFEVCILSAEFEVDCVMSSTFKEDLEETITSSDAGLKIILLPDSDKSVDNVLIIRSYYITSGDHAAARIDTSIYLHVITRSRAYIVRNQITTYSGISASVNASRYVYISTGCRG